MSERLPISVCIISGAEAHRIGRALESVAAWTSEIIVVLNDDVRDGTEEVALKHGAKVFREPWKGHVAQKNSATSKATQPWLLGLDADEVVSPGLREEISRVAAGDSAAFAAYSFPRCTEFMGRWIRHGDWYPDRQTRLWRRGAARWGGIDPHDRLEVTGAVGRLRSDLFHHAEDIERQTQKVISYGRDFVRHLRAANKKVTASDLVIRPAWRFLRAYFFRAGFLDGWAGYYLACHTSFAALNRYARAYEAETQTKS